MNWFTTWGDQAGARVQVMWQITTPTPSLNLARDALLLGYAIAQVKGQVS